MFAVYFAFGVVVTSIAPMLPLVRAELGASRGEMGFVLGAWAMIFIVTAPVAGRVIDRYGLRLSLTVGGLSVAASALARAGADSVISLWFAVAIFGIGGPLISAGAPVFARQAFTDPGERSRAVSVYVVAPALGSVVTLATTNSVLLPWLGSWRSVLVAEAALALGATGVWWMLSTQPGLPGGSPRSTRLSSASRSEVERHERPSVVNLVSRSPWLIIALALAFPIFFLNHALNTWSPTLLASVAGIGVGEAAGWVALAGLLGIGAALSVPSFGSASSRPLVLAAVCVVLGLACVALAVGPAAVAPAAMLLAGVRAAMVPLAALLLMDAPGVDNANAGVINGLWFSVGEVGGVSGPFVAGVVADSTFGFGGVAVMLGAVASVTAALLALVWRRANAGGFDRYGESMAHSEAPASDHAELVASGAQLVDVREPDETAAASLPNSIFIPLGDLPDRVGELDPARPVILLCRSGGRSGQAAEFLVANGFGDVTNLTGGMMSLGLQD